MGSLNFSNMMLAQILFSFIATLIIFGLAISILGEFFACAVFTIITLNLFNID
jgi:hypothetical protein